MKQIRRALPKDAKGIHDAHMRSIREVLSKDYSPSLVDAWGDRPFQEVEQISIINSQLVWVIDNNGEIEGFIQLGLNDEDSMRSAHIYGLYLTPDALNQGLGRNLVEMSIMDAKTEGATKVTLDAGTSTLPFYEKLGFEASGSEITIQIGGSEVSCIPMLLNLLN
jgi:GNAT superfamily N-acetyltransferase